MAHTEQQSAYEKAVSALMLIVLAAAGWGIFFVLSARQPFVEPAYLLFSAALAVLALATLFDGTDRLFSPGRGVYAAAVLTSLPVFTTAIIDTKLLPVIALAAVAAAGVWMAIRAEGEDRPWFIGLLTVLFLATGYGYAFFPGTISLLFILWLAVFRSQRRFLTAVLLIIAFAAGAVLRSRIDLGIPYLLTVSSDSGAPALKTLLALFPWSFYLIPAVIRIVTDKSFRTSWQTGAALTLLLLLVAGGFGKSGIPTVATVGGPILGLLVCSLALESFNPETSRSTRRLLKLPGLFTVLLLLAVFIMGITGSPQLPKLNSLHLTGLFVLAATLLWTTLRNNARWAFALLFASGTAITALIWQPARLFDQPLAEAEISPLLPPVVLLGLAVIGWLGSRMLFGRKLPRGACPPSTVHKYSGEPFRLFSDSSRESFGGKPVSVSDTLPLRFRFAIFGDVTGSDFPFSSRRSGYFVFRTLVRTLKAAKPHFALCLGDLAVRAAPWSYRRLRRMLRHVSVPLAVTPGNHDVFSDRTYLLNYFQALFGADNATFRAGPVRFILLNNAHGLIHDDQFAWLERILPEDHAPFSFVLCHKPLFDFRTDTFYAMEIREHAERLHELFRKHHVTAVLSGHIHALLTDVKDGMTYITSGGGGSRLVEKSASHHYLSVDVSAAEVLVCALPLGRMRKRAEQTPLLELRFTPCTFAAANPSPNPAASS